MPGQGTRVRDHAVPVKRVYAQISRLREQLQRLAEIHYKRVQALVEVLPKFIEPAMLILLGGGFAFFIIALMGPLYNMVSNLGGAQ